MRAEKPLAFGEKNTRCSPDPVPEQTAVSRDIEQRAAVAAAAAGGAQSQLVIMKS